MDVMDHKSIDKDVPYFKDVVRLVLHAGHVVEYE